MAHLSQIRSAARTLGSEARIPRETLPAIGRWQPVRLLARGGMSRVYLAHPLSAGMEAARYALKVIDERFADNERVLEQMRREALVGNSISHPHLISVLDWGVQKPPYYIVMPMLRGATLDALLKAEQFPSLPMSLWIARQVAEALVALHTANWRHADIKPANIFLAPDGHVTLLDLGLARRFEESSHVADRAIAGTLPYLPPECLTSSIAADFRSDIYSLGVTLYEVLSGRLPYAANSLGELAKLQNETTPMRLRRIVPDLPLSVANLVHDMIAHEPLRRPQTAAEVVRRLAALEIATFAERLPA